MLNDLEALEVFASLCTTGSIQKTAQALGIDSPTASRKLTKLEIYQYIAPSLRKSKIQ